MSQPNCCVTHCKNKAAADCKGLCMRCYSEAKGVVEAGKTTWEELAARGLCILASSPFMQAFESKLGKGE